MSEKISIPCVNLVSWADPVDTRVTHHQWYTPLQNIPEGINLRPNVRLQNTRSPVYRTIKEAQTNTNLEREFHNSYHLGSGGITIITRGLVKDRQRGTSNVTVYNRGALDGIVNGGHQYAAAMENKNELLLMLDSGSDIDQYMPFHVIEGVKIARINYIAKALNTNVQVTESALLYSMGTFRDIEAVLTGAGLIKHFARKGNEKATKGLPYELSDNVILMEVLNRYRYPDITKHGTDSVNAKHKVIAAYGKEATRTSLSGMVHLLPDFWTLFETIGRTGWGMIDIATPADKVGWVSGPQVYLAGSYRREKRRKVYTFPITGTSGNTRLIRSLTLSILSAFRQLLSISSANRYEWIIPFPKVLDLWQELGRRMVVLADRKTRVVERDPSSAFKSDAAGIWTGMYKIVSDHFPDTSRRL